MATKKKSRELVAEEARKAKAYSYIRMSTPEQMKGSSLQRQLGRTREYAQANGLDLIESFDDLGTSAFRGKHAEFGALKRFLALVDSGDIESGSYLIVESMDRLSRERSLTAFRQLAEIIGCGIIVVTLDDRQIYSEETFEQDQFKLHIALGSMVRAHEESRRKSDLMSHTWNGKRRQLVADGTILTRRVPSWLRADKANGRIDPIPERVEVIREIFTMTRDGYGIYSIASHLNRSGVKPWSTRKNAVWRDSYIKKILTSRTVLGEFQLHTTHVDSNRKRKNIPSGDPVIGYYPAIISPQLFQEAAAATAIRRIKGKGRKGKAYSNLLTGLLRCSCSAGMRYVDKGKKKGKGVAYLRCSVAIAGGVCKARGFRYELVERKILEHIESLDVARVMGGAPRKHRLAEVKHRLSMLEVDQAGVKRKIERIVAAIVASAKGTKLHTLTDALATLEKEDAELRVAMRGADLEIQEMQTISPKDRKQVIIALLKEIALDGDPTGVEKTRRALASELQRLIDLIVVAQSYVSEDELLSDRTFLDPELADVLELDVEEGVGEYQDTSARIPELKSREQLSKNLKSYAFELTIRYRNGDLAIVEGWRSRAIKLKSSERMKALKTNARVRAPSDPS